MLGHAEETQCHKCKISESKVTISAARTANMSFMFCRQILTYFKMHGNVICLSGNAAGGARRCFEVLSKFEN